MNAEQIQECAQALRQHHFDTQIVASTQEAFECMKRVIEAEAPKIVSFGDSMTMRETGIIEWLRENGDWTLLDGFDASMPRPERLETTKPKSASDASQLPETSPDTPDSARRVPKPVSAWTATPRTGSATPAWRCCDVIPQGAFSSF